MKRWIYGLLLGVVAGCEVLEEDISGREVAVVAPAAGVAVAAGEVEFRWQALERAAGYEFTVVSPSFAEAARVVADTVIYADTLDRRFGCQVLLDEGIYQWSVRGFNGAYATTPVVRSLQVKPADEPVAGRI